MSIIATFAGLIVAYVAIYKYSERQSEKEGSEKAVASPEFTDISRKYLAIYLAAMFADWIQGPYVYRLYSEYGYSVDKIAILFVAGFGSSMVMGTFVSSLADTCGRRNSCLIFCVLYFASCLTKHSPMFELLLLGRVLGGIATSILYSAFEAWLISEAHSRQLHQSQLGSIFSLATTGNGIVAIVSGVIASAANDMWGVVAPFDVSAFVLAGTAIAILSLWNENYGDKSASSTWMGNFKFGEAFAKMNADKRILALGISQSLYESAMYIFVFLWTPTLEKAGGDIEHGWIFACFMVCCMIGSECFGILQRITTNVEEYAYNIFAVASFAFCIPVVSGNYALCLGSFFLFEVCCGLYWPVMGTLRGKIIPDDVRSTMMSLFRLPLNLIVVVTLVNLKSMDEKLVWIMCAVMLLVSSAIQYYFLNIRSGVGRYNTIKPDETEMEEGKTH